MANVVNFKCPCCGARLTFDGTAGEMTCAYCDAHFTMEQVKAAEEAETESGAVSDMVWNTPEQQILSDADGKVQGYSCPSCGAQMVGDENTAATECPYCGNPAIIPQSFEGMYRPERVIPFAVGKDEAQAKLREFTRGKKLLPDSFTDGNRIEEITGLYVPFWLYSCRAQGSVSFEGVKAKRWEDAKFRYEQKDHYRLTRQGAMDFERIPVDAATRMDDAMMDSLEPYDFSGAKEYDAAYFSGYLADRYDVEEKDAQPRANERVENTFRAKMREAVHDYTEVSQKSESIRLSNAKAEYAMLPVWMLSTKYEDKIYSFGINGQTGKMVGALPVDKGKYAKFFAVAAAIALVISAALSYFAGERGFSVAGVLIAVAVSVLIGWAYASYLKAAMNTVAKQTSAASYLKEGSLEMGRPVDRFLYSKTEKREKNTSNAQNRR